MFSRWLSPENTVSKIICLASAKWSFRLIKPLESSSLQFHAVAFIARSSEGSGQFYLACVIRVIYTPCATKRRGNECANFPNRSRRSSAPPWSVYRLSIRGHRWCNWKRTLIIKVNDKLDISSTLPNRLHNSAGYLVEFLRKETLDLPANKHDVFVR